MLSSVHLAARVIRLQCLAQVGGDAEMVLLNSTDKVTYTWAYCEYCGGLGDLEHNLQGHIHKSSSSFCYDWGDRRQLRYNSQWQKNPSGWAQSLIVPCPYCSYSGAGWQGTGYVGLASLTTYPDTPTHIAPLGYLEVYTADGASCGCGALTSQTDQGH